MIDAATNAWLEDTTNWEGEASYFRDTLCALLDALDDELDPLGPAHPKVQAIVDEANLVLNRHAPEGGADENT